ncbi:MAG: sulfotransferase family protein [Promethearchaeota archaeon]
MSLNENFINEIYELCQKRGNDYPKRTEYYYFLNKKIEDFIRFLNKDFTFKNFKPNNEILTGINRFKNNPVFICGNQRSGTSLLSQLLDGHENLFVLPGDSGYLKKFFNKNYKFEDLVTHWIKRLINPTGKPPFFFCGKDISFFYDFIGYLNYFCNIKKILPFHSVIYSIYAANPLRNNKIKYWIEKTPGNEFFVEKILKRYPKAKFIHIIRDPLNVIISIKKLYSYRKKEFNLLKEIFDISKSFNKALYNRKKYGAYKYYIIKYEDLIKTPKLEMKKISNFLKVKYDDILLIPTENTKPAISNTMFKNSRVIGKINKNIDKNKWISDLSKRERDFIISILYHLSIKMGYLNWKNEKIKKHYHWSINLIYNKINNYLNRSKSLFSHFKIFYKILLFKLSKIILY